ncbi:hypothetical protein OOJ91_13835 [Micromonospora lupini]|uniref:hypothetical protein n=1 Tax=Micromonospora lupini TaxID=285679 RepID=UPI002250501F|nr:hypothetical protein [Micromonospora lupini]MCX5066928.1 hypothetical protein [Micromonospora lupini]
MTKPYNDADVQAAASALKRSWDYRDPHTQSDARAVLDALAAAGRLAPVDDPDAVQRMLDDATHAFTHARPGAERVEVIRDMLEGWYAAWPATAVTDEHDGIARHLAALIDEAEARAVACPCLPGAPKHRHGVGGYSTSGELATETQHVITFAGDGTWTMEHSLGCRVTPRRFGCRVRQLAERQITSELAVLMAGGRYTCHSVLGDLFQLGGRLHDDQCTEPVCAACGCWCHDEEQPTEPACCTPEAGSDVTTVHTNQRATITIERPDDEVLEVHVDGQLVATANHDEHGWSGMDAVEKTAIAVARACGAFIECDTCGGDAAVCGHAQDDEEWPDDEDDDGGPSIVTVELPGISR